MYAFTCDVALPFDDAVEKFKQALAAEKMGVVSEINVAHIMKAKLNAEMPCGVAAMALDANTTRFSFQDPETMAGVTDNAVMHEVAGEAKAMLLRVRDRLAA